MEAAPEATPDVSVVLVTFNAIEHIGQCLDHLYASEGALNIQVICVDNASIDGTPKFLEEHYPQVELICNEDNRGFGRGCNQGFERARSEVVLLLNTDAYVDSQALPRTLEYFSQNRDWGVIGAQIYHTDGEFFRSGLRYPTIMTKIFRITGLANSLAGSSVFNCENYGLSASSEVVDVDWVPGCFTGLRRSMLDEIGGFDPRFFLYYEETDLCLRAKKSGWRVCVVPDVKVAHEGGRSTRFQEERGEVIGGDQVLSFAYRSEHLYTRKNHGFLAMLVNSSVELLWFSLCYLKNLLPLEGAERKRAQYGHRLYYNWKALRDTAGGKHSPPQPW